MSGTDDAQPMAALVWFEHLNPGRRMVHERRAYPWSRRDRSALVLHDVAGVRAVNVFWSIAGPATFTVAVAGETVFWLDLNNPSNDGLPAGSCRSSKPWNWGIRTGMRLHSRWPR